MIALGRIQFATPWVLALLVLLPIWWIIRRRRTPERDRLLARRRPGRRTACRTADAVHALPASATSLLASTIVALSRPRSGSHSENTTSEGINIVLAIDLSSSMLAQDFTPNNRLEVAKDVVKRFIAARSSDRIGVVAFASRSAHAGAAHDRLSRGEHGGRQSRGRVSSRTARRSAQRSRRRPTGCATRRADRA